MRIKIKDFDVAKLPVNYDKLSSRQRRLTRQEYANRQQQKCYHCGKHLSLSPSNDIVKMKINKKLFPLNFFNNPIHLHHDHNSGLTIGAVHAYCNAVLWQYERK